MLQQKRKIVKLVAAICKIACSLDEEIKRVGLELNTAPLNGMFLFEVQNITGVLSKHSQCLSDTDVCQRVSFLVPPQRRKGENSTALNNVQQSSFFGSSSSHFTPFSAAAVGDRIRTALTLRLPRAEC